MEIDLPELIDNTTGTQTTCNKIKAMAQAMSRGEGLSAEEIGQVLQDLANIRYRYTLERCQQQVVEILSRTWESPEEALLDLRQALRWVKWVGREYRDIDSQSTGDK